MQERITLFSQRRMSARDWYDLNPCVSSITPQFVQDRLLRANAGHSSALEAQLRLQFGFESYVL